MSRPGGPLHPLVRALAVVGGVLLAAGIGLAARVGTGHPPGVAPEPLAHLLGRPAPSFSLPGATGTTVSLAGHAGAPFLLFFTEGGCGACEAAYPSVAEEAARLPIVVIAVGDRQALPRGWGEPGVGVEVAYDTLRVVTRQYRIPGLPAALLVDAQGVVREGALGPESLKRVMARGNQGQGGAP